MLIIEDAFWSSIAALGFAMMFNVPRRTLWACVICGAAGHAVRTVFMDYFDITIIFATLIGATVVGFLGAYFASRLHAPAMIFTVPGAIPMVPGVFAYQTMLGLLKIADMPADSGAEILMTTSTNAINTGLILVMLAAGIIAPELLFQNRKPVV